MIFAPDPAAIRLLDQALRADRGRILSALIARVRDFQLAEDALHDAAASALIHWTKSGLPTRPEAWLIRVAFRKAIDRLRKTARDAAQTQAMTILARDEAEEEPEAIADERLRLIFTCCHPALEPKSRVALTLRTIAGLSTAAIAAAFLDNETTMGQRLTRAKSKITAARIPFVIPELADWPERLNSVLTVVYLIFTTGHAIGPVQGHDLCEEALFLARLLAQLAPEEPEIEACLALILLTHARRAARQNASGATIALTHQDRALWDRAQLDEGLPLVERALLRHRLGPFQIKAAIAACHVRGPVTDWAEIAELFATLYRFEPTPVVALNHAVALGEARGPQAGLQALLPLAEDLAYYQPFHAALADLSARTGGTARARIAYARAIDLAGNPADATFLLQRLADLRD
jgi:RNA polymerase sigma factor (sigma-70 family)